MRLFGFKITREKRAVKVTLTDQDKLYGFAPVTSSGAVVTPDTAMRVDAVHACVRVLSETLASLPLILYRKLAGGGREPATDHPLYKLLHYQPNEKQTSNEFRESMMIDLCLRGKGYAHILRTEGGRTLAISHLAADRIHKEINPVTGQATYSYYNDIGEKIIYPESAIFIVTAMGGLSPIDLARETVGDLATMRTHSSKFYANAARISGVLEHPGKVQPQALKNLRDSWEKQYSGANNAGKTVILEQGMKFHNITMTNEQAQFIENYQLSRRDIAAIFRVPPHLIGDLSEATYSNIEQQSLEFIQYTMLPWFVRWEMSIVKYLLGENEALDYKAEFLADAILRGDGLTRAQKLQIERQNGVLSIDEWREIENRNPLPKKLGDIYQVPMNMDTLGQGKPIEATKPGAPPTMPGKQSPNPNEPTKNVPPENKGVERLIRRDVACFLEWEAKRSKIDWTQQRTMIRDKFEPLIYTLLEIKGKPGPGAEELAGSFADRWCERSKGEEFKSVTERTEKEVTELLQIVEG